ncbi:MAG: type I DNA topoisomerase [Candidatus Tectomicrobia bacterium]|nr:type I DNA topoisomerase [Candidatus Tectomicrobia bacterium]
MTQTLVIVESPAKASTLKKFLKDQYRVAASVGHLKDLPPNRLGVDIENDFAPEYTIIEGKRKVLSGLKAAAAKSDTIYLAPDPDREGEAIAWHIHQEIAPVARGKIYRITFNEITQQAVRRAVEHPGQIDQNKVDAQQARRVLDRLVGYKLSPLLGRRLRNWGLSAGRVQSVALRLLCDREHEIQTFAPEEYWSITARLSAEEPPAFGAALHQVHGQKAEIPTGEKADAILAALAGSEYRVSKVERKNRRRKPVPPFITSTLQQEASRRLRFTAKKTMALAQQLYEGLEAGEEGATGLITYMRTDSTRIAQEALDEARRFIGKEYGKDYLPAQPQVYPSKKGAQDAHEAVRPTSAARTPDSLKGFLTKDQLALYRLIWNRFMASQMNPAVYDQTSVDIAAGPCLFRATGSVLLFPGFTRLYEEETDEAEKREFPPLPPLKEGQVVACEELVPKQHFTQPPPRYTEASLVRALEEKGIGRPSTYAGIVSTLTDRDYARIEKRQMHPTDLGMMVSNLLVKNFPDLMNVGFTAEMESRLDRIEDGKESWTRTLEDFYSSFEKALKGAEKTLNAPEPTGRQCPECGGELVKRPGRYGMFVGCSNYPDCRYRESTGKREAPPAVETDIRCEKCGAAMVVKTGRHGPFLSCSRYPECQNAKPLPTGVSCPREGCDGEIVTRRSKRGRPFYGCSNYPACDFVSWARPYPKSCPACGSPYLTVQRKELRCPQKGCSHREPLPDDGELAGTLAGSPATGGSSAAERAP